MRRSGTSQASAINTYQLIERQANHDATAIPMVWISGDESLAKAHKVDLANRQL